MGLPKVDITIVGGGLNRQVEAADGVSLLVIAASNMYPALTEQKFFSLREAENAGATEENDKTHSSLVWEHIKDFYRYAGAGVELNVIILTSTVTLEDMFTPSNAANDAIKAYLNVEKGNIKLLGCALNPATDTTGAGITPDALTAIPLAQTYALAERALYRPISIFMEGRAFNGTPASATDIRAQNSNRVSVIFGQDTERIDDIKADVPAAERSAALGAALGKAAGEQVMRNIGRVKSGELGWNQTSLSGGQDILSFERTELDALNDKGYIFAVNHPGADGFYWNDSPTCVDATDDFAYIEDGRVIDKVFRITNEVFVQELKDNIDIDPETGQMPSSQLKYFEGIVEDAINAQMTATEEITSVEAIVDVQQNVLATGKIMIQVKVVPRGMAREFEIEIGFDNPAS